MAQSILTRQQAEAAVSAVKVALAAGHPLRGRLGRNPTAVAVAAKALGLSPSTVQHRLARAETVYGLTVGTVAAPAPQATGDPAPPPEDPPDLRDLYRLRRQNAALQQQLKETLRDSVEAEDVRRSILGLAAVTPDPPDWLIEPGAGSGITGVPSVICSDWHIGEVVNPAEVNGVNAYNLAIAEERIIRLTERVIDLCKHHMTSPRYPGIVVNLLGDIVSGDIHQELSETNETELFPAILWARDRIVTMLRTLADAFGQVFVPCAAGNHGRTTRKPQAKRYAAKNADWLLYCLVERALADRGDTRIRMMIPETGEALYRVYHHRYMGVHGDDLGVKGGDGIIGAIGPIMRGEIKVRHSSAQIDRDYDTLLMGHWHQTLFLPRAIVNNTLKGYDEFARRMLRAPASDPSQVLWFTHPRHGITARWDIGVLERPTRPQTDWISWSAA